jgi:hypothetical protein
MRAIETRYKGYRFRSRLEARWAVFFDALDLEWEYEPEGFHLPSGEMYLPDFRLRTPGGQTIWYEVKPEGVTSDSKFDAFDAACHADGVAGGHWAVMLSGDPVSHMFEPGSQVKMCPRCGLVDRPAYGLDQWIEETGVGCQICDFETPSGGYHPWEVGRFGFSYRNHKGSVILDNGSLIAFNSIVQYAAEKARSARFEHGECPA